MPKNRIKHSKNATKKYKKTCLGSSMAFSFLTVFVCKIFDEISFKTRYSVLVHVTVSNSPSPLVEESSITAPFRVAAAFPSLLIN